MSTTHEATSEVCVPSVSHLSSNCFGWDTLRVRPGASPERPRLGSVEGGTVVVVAPGTVVVTTGAVVVVTGAGTVVVTGAGSVVEGESTMVVVDSGIVVAGAVVVVTGVSPGSSTRLTIGVVAALFFCTRRVRISETDSDGFIDNRRAARPATCGDAIEVPEIVRVALAPPIHDEVICEPGAHMSTHDPVFE